MQRSGDFGVVVPRFLGRNIAAAAAIAASVSNSPESGWGRRVTSTTPKTPHQRQYTEGLKKANNKRHRVVFPPIDGFHQHRIQPVVVSKQDIGQESIAYQTDLRGRHRHLGVVVGSVAVFAFLQFTTFGMVVRAGMADRETVGILGIDIDKRFTIMFGIAAAVAGLAGVMYAPINSPNYHMGMDFLVLSFVVVVVGGMGSLPGAVLAGFLLGILESFASMNEIKSIIPGIDQIIIYVVAIIILLTRPRGLMGRKGVMED